MRTARTLLAPLALLLSLTLALALGSCSGGDKPKADPATTLAAAKKTLDATPGVRIGLSTGKLPTGVNGLLFADGVGTHAPAFQGDIKVSAGGVTADAAVVAVGGVVYAKLPFTSKFAKINPAQFGAPDPAELMKPDGGLSSLLTSATDVEEGKQVREGQVVLSSYRATVPGKAVASVIPSATASADFKATFTVNDQLQLAKAVLTGPFYPKADDVTYSITFADYGTTKNISAP